MIMMIQNLQLPGMRTCTLKDTVKAKIRKITSPEVLLVSLFPTMKPTGQS